MHVQERTGGCEEGLLIWLSPIQPRDPSSLTLALHGAVCYGALGRSSMPCVCVCVCYVQRSAAMCTHSNPAHAIAGAS